MQRLPWNAVACSSPGGALPPHRRRPLLSARPQQPKAADPQKVGSLGAKLGATLPQNTPGLQTSPTRHPFVVEKQVSKAGLAGSEVAHTPTKAHRKLAKPMHQPALSLGAARRKQRGSSTHKTRVTSCQNPRALHHAAQRPAARHMHVPALVHPMPGAASGPARKNCKSAE